MRIRLTISHYRQETMYIKRLLSENLIEAAREFPVVAVVGPRQSGKTTLVQKIFEKHSYRPHPSIIEL